MDEKELQKAFSSKVKEIKALRDLGSRNLKFKNWHVSTLSLLKHLPKEFTKQANEFKRLAFTDTKYHRSKRPEESEDIQIFNKDLDSAAKILKSIKPSKQKDQE